MSSVLNGAYFRDIVLILKNQWPRKHTENTEYSQIISVSSVDSVAIYNHFDLSSAHPQTHKLTAETHDCREKVRPGTGREAGLGQKVRPGIGRETGLGRARLQGCRR